MAYVKKYQAKFNTDNGTNRFRVELLLNNGTGSSSDIVTLSSSVLDLNSISGFDKDIDGVIVGSEIVFSFNTNDHTLYDIIYNSEYRDWRIDVYDDVTDTLDFRGYVQPENLYRELYESWIEIELTATDAIIDLQHTEFDLTSLDEKETILAVIKQALTPIGIELDFRIKLGIYETRLSSSELCLLNNYIDVRRFTREVNGALVVDSCLDVIRKSLEPFDVLLRQSEGRYYIGALHEIYTHEYAVSWSTLAATRAVTDNVINIDGFQYEPGGQLSKVAPVKYLDITHRNRNIGENIVSELDDFSSASSPWDFSSLGYARSVVDGALKIEVFEPFTGGKGFMITTPVEISVITEGDYFQISFEFLYKNLIDSSSVAAGFNVNLIVERQHEGSWISYAWFPASITLWDINQWWSFGTPLLDMFQITQTGTYRVRFELFTYGEEFTADLYLRNFVVNKLFTVDDDLVSGLTFDRALKYTSEAGKKRVEKEFWFGDSFGTGDLGRYIVNISGEYLSTVNWNRYEKTDNLPILDLYAQVYLNRRSQFTDHILLGIWDYDYDIKPSTVIELEGKYYIITSYRRNYHNNFVNAQLSQVITND